MIVKIEGTVLKVRNGVNKNTNKPYFFADVYDGDSVVRIYGLDDVTDGELVEVKCRLFVNSDGRVFVRKF